MHSVLITGIDKGIGAALANRFLVAGDSVIGTVKETKGMVLKRGLTSYELDLASPKSIAACAEQIAKSNIKFDALINNAGILLDRSESVVNTEKLRQTLEVNLIGTIDFTEHILPLIQPGGHIINVSSTAGSLALTEKTPDRFPVLYAAYKISKAGLNMYTRTLALRLESRDITVSSVHPGWVKTDMGGPDADLPSEEAAEDIFRFSLTKPVSGRYWFKGQPLPW